MPSRRSRRRSSERSRERERTDFRAATFGPKPVPGRPQGMGGVTTGLRAYP